jgi:hypothetical protein
MKAALLAIGLAFVALATPANASWAENSNMEHPVFTGTSRSLASAMYESSHHRHFRRARPHSRYR